MTIGCVRKSPFDAQQVIRSRHGDFAAGEIMAVGSSDIANSTWLRWAGKPGSAVR